MQRKVSTKYFTEEDHTQSQIVEYLRWQYQHALVVHVPNEGRGKISFTQMNKIKALGVKSGVSDLLFFDPREGFNGLAMEVKTPKGTVSKKQRDFLANLSTRKWLTCVVRSFDQAKAIIDDYYKSDNQLHTPIMETLKIEKIEKLNFGEAVELMKKGQALQREGWNGKGMYVVYQKGYPDGIAINKNTSEATKLPEGTVCIFRPYLMMRTVDGSFVPWVASQTDILAEDWQCLPQTA